MSLCSRYKKENPFILFPTEKLYSFVKSTNVKWNLCAISLNTATTTATNYFIHINDTVIITSAGWTTSVNYRSQNWQSQNIFEIQNNIFWNPTKTIWITIFLFWKSYQKAIANLNKIIGSIYIFLQIWNYM